MKEYSVCVHWIIFLNSIIFIPLILYLIMVLNFYEFQATTINMIITIVECFVATILLTIKPFIDYYTTTMKVDEKGVHISKGLINISTQDYGLDGIESIEVKKDLLGLILNYGRVIIRGKGNNFHKLKSLPIAEPQKFKDVLLEFKN